MSSFDIRQDAPGLLRVEALNMTLKFDRTSPTTARISWNIPSPAAGCAAGTQAYNGIVITVDNTPTNISKIPKNTVAYTADPTVDPNLFAGDKLDSAMIVGAFYDDLTTTFVDITGLKPNTPYYVTGFPVDAQLRYFIEGIHAYSMDFDQQKTDGTHGTQVVVLNPEQSKMGVLPTDNTGLDTLSSYQFSIQVGVVPAPASPVDSVDCVPSAPIYEISIDGAAAQTYQDLVNEINKKLALVTQPPQGPNPPATGTYYWNASQKKLFVWNGYTLQLISNVIVQSTDPSIVAVGTYWYDPEADILKHWDGANWQQSVVIKFATDPAIPLADETYWFDGTTGYLWNGATWCKILTYIDTVDPSEPVVPITGSYWHDTEHGILYRWNHVLGTWLEASVIQYPQDPNMLDTGTYWFNETNNTLYAYNTPSVGWNPQSNVAISENPPTTPAPSKFWYNPTTMDLYQRNISNTAWDLLDVIAFPIDPTVREVCDLWWNTATDTLYVWDTLTVSWIQAPHVYEQGIDPSLPINIDEGTLWFDPSTNKLYVWINNCFVNVSYVFSLTDPRNIDPGTIWFNTTSKKWYERQSSNTWLEISPTISTVDPSTISVGTFWFNISNNSLQQWNGISWVTVMYITSPVIPTKGSLWYNTDTGTLMIWNGSSWVPATPPAMVELDCNGNLLFTDNTVGSLSFIGITDISLFQSLANKFAIHSSKPGVDGISSQPSYDELGIGTDGSADERLLLQNEIRYELGYPVLDVELTPEQLDYAITKALTELRQKSGLAYTRGFFFMQINPETQKFYLTNKIQGMNKIVDVMGVYRLTSSFLSSAHGAGVYGQIVLQHLYNMGTFDLLSYHIIGEYTKLMETLFAARITFTWNEQKRELFVHHRFPFTERMVAIEATVERTEQEIMTDRYARPWIRRYALATARLMLAEIRGKFSTLPGANGSVTLNAQELRQAAKEEIEMCMDEIESYVADNPEEYGVGGIITFG